MMRSRLSLLLLASGVILSLAMGIRHGFGFFMAPITGEHGWGREAFALALGLQNLVWGVAQPFSGAIADRRGPARVLLIGALCYAAGLLLMTVSATPWQFSLSAGVLIGFALSCTTYSVIFGVIARTVPTARRSRAMGIASAAGSFGQFALVPVERSLIDAMGWIPALVLLAGAIALCAPLAKTIGHLDDPAQRPPETGRLLPKMAATFAQAWRERSFRLLMAGYFVCGFQVVFIGVHLPVYLRDKGMSGSVASLALALIGLFNVFGSFCAGEWGSRIPKPRLLSGLYLARSVIIALFLLCPLSSWSVALFAASIGFLWLATVPLTNGIIASQFGVGHLGLLSGAVFFAHQAGSFLGVWLGGWVFDATGSYDIVWIGAILLGVMASLANLPIREEPVASFAGERPS
ncbi:MFS transporter [Paludibacterium paludis]|uniref:MFS transporter n=1 Tax=Paludibacterium paludis TaxID=1225769 RepID=A0A918P5P8_9NEIS|nr:MFS transporter [Paludibacterium paludis]GGY22574.1 MFS transporter [Paludibacterium paludis]